MLWFSLIPDGADDATLDERAWTQRLLGWWALRFSPRVVLRDEAVLVEVAASLRLFKGAQALQQQLRDGAPAPGWRRMAWGPTSLAALALSRHQDGSPATALLRAGAPHPVHPPDTADLLAPLPLHTLSAAHPHLETLSQMGCHTLGALRRLPRGGVARRFGASLLDALDQAHGLRPDTLPPWLTLPEVFDERLELPFRVESTEAVLQAAEHLLRRLQEWLTLRHAGVLAIVLRWRHDMASRQAGDGEQLEVRTAQAVRHVEHLARLLAEHLAHVRLKAPVGELSLYASEIERLPGQALSLLPDDVPSGEALRHTLEKLSVRLGDERVLRPVALADHRPGHMQAWVPCTQACATPTTAPATSPHTMPLPVWILERPVPLEVRDHQPRHHGPLSLLAGPQRIEGGWWDHTRADGPQARDYFIASSPAAGLLWIYKERVPLAAEGHTAAHWYLHGVYG